MSVWQPGRVQKDERKGRGAFFTPPTIAAFVTDWAVRAPDDRVLEPSAGEAVFLVQAVRRLNELRTACAVHLAGRSEEPKTQPPRVDGIEIHQDSVQRARALVQAAGGDPHIDVQDFFLAKPEQRYSVVIGNPPFVRYQDFSGQARVRSREAARRAGVALTGLASSWAAFVVHSALFLQPGGRMGLVVPAELLSVNYAAPVRQFLFERFRTIELVLFAQLVFADAQADVVLLLADGFDEGPAEHITVFNADNAESLVGERSPAKLGKAASVWTPTCPANKWTELLVSPNALTPLSNLLNDGHFTHLETWGDTTLGMVTGNNSFFALSAAQVAQLELSEQDLIRISPPGSSHLRGLALTEDGIDELAKRGKATWLFRPSEPLSDEARAYIESGERIGIDLAYKCRVRTPWYRMPLNSPADLLLTCMNADTPRLTTNRAKVRHLNSVHGVYLHDDLRRLGQNLLPIASLNSITALHAEIVGRAYGGGILKIEPREADHWAVPSPSLVRANKAQLREITYEVAANLASRRLCHAMKQVDEVLFSQAGPPHSLIEMRAEVQVEQSKSTQKNSLVADEALNYVRSARRLMLNRRIARARRQTYQNDAANRDKTPS